MTSVQAAVNADVGLAVVLVMDTSGSMAGEPLSLAEEAAVSFVNSLLPKDGAIVIPFADNVGAPSPLTADKQALATTLRGLQAGGSTALYDAVVAAAQSAKSAPLPRKVVVLLTDGQESGNRSAADVDRSLSEAVGLRGAVLHHRRSATTSTCSTCKRWRSAPAASSWRRPRLRTSRPSTTTLASCCARSTWCGCN